MVKNCLAVCRTVILFLWPIVCDCFPSTTSKSASSGRITNCWYSYLARQLSAFATTVRSRSPESVIDTHLADRMRRKQYQVVMFFTNIPLLNADIVTGIALMLWFVRFLPLGFTSLLLAHVTFNIPYVILCVLPKLRQMDVNLYEAARDLGANSRTAFFKITFPFILPGVLSGFFLAVTMSMDDFVITYFTKGAGVNTLSTMIYGEIRKGIKPEMYALSTILFLIILLLLILMNIVPRLKNREQTASAVRDF
ncbi:MAG: ABC transporter permease [Lachnospiraceae bacterium]